MKFSQKRLKNGVKLMVAPMKESLAVTVLIMVHTGSKYEKKQFNGISHFVEHMCFKGTTQRPTALSISKALDEIGAQYNAYTSQEFTGYYVKTNPKHIDRVIDVLSDVYLNSVFDQKEIEKEKKVIIEEIRMYEDAPHKQIHDVFSYAMYGDQPAGWNILGSKETVLKMNARHLSQYYKSHYVAKATTVIVSGNIDTRIITRKIEKALQAIPQTKKLLKKPVIEPQDKPKIYIKHKNTDQVHIALGVRTFAGKHKHSYTMKVIDALLGGGVSSRLFQKLREDMGASYDLRTIVDEYTDHGFFSVCTGTEKKRVREVIRAMIGECKELTHKGSVSIEELGKAKEYLIGNTVLSLEQSDSLAEYYAIQDVTGETVVTPEQMIKKIRQVSIEDVHRVAKEIFVNSGLVVALIGNISESDALKKTCRF
jgi:predicted Zn-dependent peptidase